MRFPYNWKSMYQLVRKNKVGCGFPMIVVSILSNAEFGPNDHREDASHFKIHVIENNKYA